MGPLDFSLTLAFETFRGRFVDFILRCSRRLSQRSTLKLSFDLPLRLVVPRIVWGIPAINDQYGDVDIRKQEHGACSR
jgi:hypothetical protein